MILNAREVTWQKGRTITMRNTSALAILGFVSLVASGACGSESSRPTASPPNGLFARGSSPIQPGSRSPDPVTDASKDLPTDSTLSLPVRVLIRAPAVKTSDPGLDPLVAYLKTSFATPIKDGRRLVITPVNGKNLLAYAHQSYQEMVEGLLVSASEQIPKEMIRDFAEKNRVPIAVWPELLTHLPAQLLTPEEYKLIFAGHGEGWERFYAKYPDAYALIDISHVGLNREKNLALFYVAVSHGPLTGHGSYHVLKKEGNMWVELPVYIGSSWIS